MFSSFLIFSCYFTRLKVREISCKIWETRKIFPILHSAPYDNNYLLIDDNLDFRVESYEFSISWAGVYFMWWK